MPMIRETIVSTVDGAGRVHLRHLGIIGGGRRLDHCAIPPLDDARQFARRSVRSRKLHR